MSRAGAEFFKPDGTLIGYGLYDGTSDMMMPGIYATQAAAWAEYMPRADWDRAQVCEGAAHEAEACVLYSDYGNGFWWRGTYCPRCRIVRGPLSLLDSLREDTGERTGDGHPFPRAADQTVEVCAEPAKP